MDTYNALLNTLQSWLVELQSPANWVQLLILFFAGGLAWYIHRHLGSYLGTDAEGLRRLTQRGIQRILFPISMLIGMLIGRAILSAMGIPVPLLDIAVPLLLSLAAVRLVVYILRKGFSQTPTLKAWEHLASTLIWVYVAIYLLGWMPAVTTALDALAFNLGNIRFSALSAIKLILLVGLFFTLALWLAGTIENRVKLSPNLSAGMKVGLAKFSKFFLLTLSTLLALDAVGIDLQAFAIFGGALGVGIGFGLQRIASNFISGFIVIFDRSIRPGDVITIGDKFGWVEELRARYIVVRNREGVETLIPNENLITSEVINWSYTDQNVRVRIPVSISYNDDPEQAMALMMEAAQASPRVLADPIPAVRLMEFGDNGIQLELRVWINDPEEGIGNVRSAINLAIWRNFKAAGITIPFPQRDVHVIPTSDNASLANNQ